MVIRTLLDLVRELNSLNDDNLACRVVDTNDVQWCLSELQCILEAEQSALSSASREQAEKAWKGEWERPQEGLCQCSRCGHSFLWLTTSFCPGCGRAMTEEAVDMVMERLEALKDG